MKKINLFLAAIMAVMVFASCEEGNDTIEKVLTFEGAAWNALIDNPEYGGKLLYGEEGQGFDHNAYTWTDAETGLSTSGLVNAWGAYAYWNGGMAISNYVMTDYSKASYTNQLSVPVAPLNGTNFCVFFGTGEPGALPYLYFPAGEAHTIKSMSVIPTSYLLNTLKNGDGWSIDAIAEGQYVDIAAYGYDVNGNLVKETSLRLADGQNIVTNWKTFDLSSLGDINKLELAVVGNVNNSYGFAEPAYFAFDNVVVVFNE
ncbi:MAG: DUF4465 domain-containing protein [Bacteroidaceae bacterium]|nr:DUF4465 domain-containing protein [Bacteroidaceae bacterium]